MSEITGTAFVAYKSADHVHDTPGFGAVCCSVYRGYRAAAHLLLSVNEKLRPILSELREMGHCGEPQRGALANRHEFHLSRWSLIGIEVPSKGPYVYSREAK